jgi:hypothetical protein
MKSLIKSIQKYEKRTNELADIKEKIIKTISRDLENILPKGDIHQKEGIHFNELKEKVEKKYNKTIPFQYIQEALDKMANVSEIEGYYLKTN